MDKIGAAYGKRYRLAVLNTHPIQYFAPLYRRITEASDIDITVYYCSRQGLDGGHVDPGFGQEVIWDIALLEGYRSKFLPNLGGDRGVNGFMSLFNPSIIYELWREHYDAILIHGHNYATSILALITAKLLGSQIFIRGETHLLLERGPFKSIFRRPLMSLFYKLCNACLYIGTRNHDFYLAHGVPEKKLFLVPYAVDNDYFISRAALFSSQRKRVKAELGIAPEVSIILFSSKLIGRKRPMDLVRAFEKLKSTGIEANLLMVGDGPERGKIEQYLFEHQLTNVQILGFKNQSELSKYYAIADVFVLPSENEPWGLVVNEVMCAGVPVIATKEVGAAPDLVMNGNTGYVYKRGDIDALALAMEKLIKDPSLREQMRCNALEKIKQWGYPQCIEGIRNALAKQ